MAFGSDRLPALFHGAVIALRKAGTHARFRLLAPRVAQRPFAPVPYYWHRHRSYGLMRQCPAHPHLSRLFVGYSAGLRDETPSLLCIPDLVTVLPPLRRRAPLMHSPNSCQGIPPSPGKYGSALSTPRNCLHAGRTLDVAAISSCCNPVTRSPSWAVPSCDGESFILGACAEAVAQPRRPIRYAAVRLLPRPVLPRLV
jgi:hypothetical protein